MPGAVVAVVVTTADPRCCRTGAALFAGAALQALSRAELRPREPFRGPLFDLCAAQPPDSCLGLVVPIVWRGGSAAGGGAGVPRLVAIADHVNLASRGPLCGRWPAGVQRTFPPLTGIYQPGAIRALGGPRVYSSGVIVAGVANAGRLTPFEAGAVEQEDFPAVSDVLVPAAIVAAYYGFTLAACGIPQADDRDDK